MCDSRHDTRSGIDRLCCWDDAKVITQHRVHLDGGRDCAVTDLRSDVSRGRDFFFSLKDLTDIPMFSRCV